MIQRREGKEVNARWKDRMEMEGRRKREEVAKKSSVDCCCCLAFWHSGYSLSPSLLLPEEVKIYGIRIMDEKKSLV